MATRADIRTLAQLFADQDSSDFPTIAQYNLLVDAAGKRVWYDLWKAGWPVDFSTTTITANGSLTYPLSGGSPAPTTPIAAIHGVYYVLASERFMMRRINEGYRAQLTSAVGLTGFAEFYDIRINATGGYILELLPKSSGGTYSVDYIPSFGGFTADGTVWPGPDRSDELVAIQAAINGIRKEGAARRQDMMDLKQDYQELLQGVTDQAAWINYREPAMIRDVNTTRSRYAFDYPVAGPGGDF